MNTLRSVVNATSNVTDCKKEGYSLPRCIVAEVGRTATTGAAEFVGGAMATIGSATGPATVVAGASIYALSDKMGDFAADKIKGTLPKEPTALPEETVIFVEAPVEIGAEPPKKTVIQRETTNIFVQVNQIEEIVPMIAIIPHETLQAKLDYTSKCLSKTSSALAGVGAFEEANIVNTLNQGLQMASAVSEMAMTGLNPLSALTAISSGIGMFNSIFGRPKQDGTGKALSMIANLIVRGFNMVLQRIDELERNMTIRFDAIEDKLERQHYETMKELTRIYEQGHDLFWYISNSATELTNEVRIVGRKTDALSINLGTTAATITSNLNSFRHEKIHELLYCIRYDQESGELTQAKAKTYLPLLYNAIFTIATNDFVNGRNLFKANLETQIAAFEAAGINLIGLFAEYVGFTKPIPHYVLWSTILKYINCIHSIYVDGSEFRNRKLDEIRTMGANLMEFRETLRTAILGKPINKDQLRLDAFKTFQIPYKERQTQQWLEYRDKAYEAIEQYKKHCTWKHYTQTAEDLKAGQPYKGTRPFCNSRGSSLLSLVVDGQSCFCGTAHYGQNHPYCLVGGMHAHLEPAVLDYSAPADELRTIISEISTSESNMIEKQRVTDFNAYIQKALVNLKTQTSVCPFIELEWNTSKYVVPLTSSWGLKIPNELAELGAWIKIKAYLKETELTYVAYVCYETIEMPIATYSQSVKIPTKEQNEYGRVMDLVIGGRFGELNQHLVVKFHHWNHDGAHAYSQYEYTYPDRTVHSDMFSTVVWTPANYKTTALWMKFLSVATEFASKKESYWLSSEKSRNAELQLTLNGLLERERILEQLKIETDLESIV